MDEDTNDNVDVSEQFEGDEVILPTFYYFMFVSFVYIPLKGIISGIINIYFAGVFI